ncbi:MAG: type I DNA topoisomerase [Maioricimonas sp. JB045]|mgnify:CR=1 FL=1|uniref:type I DNA topoisomerase n=1 Tax=Maioricimonas sp. JC845 TaxID=3232138 RepID=UPI003459BCED
MAQKRKKGLVIVESPAKAKKIGGFLGKDYEVRASMGHVRDLPASAKEVPASIKKEPWSTLGVNTTADFEPVYVVPPEKKKVVKELKDALKDADELILATDEDREGESIGWHLAELLKPKVPVKRMVFSEITRKAILDALHHPRELDRNLVEAQEARRVLDRLYGYTLSPLLWKKIARGLSAGRVQSVAVRILVRRELERLAFRSGTYWDLKAEVATTSDEGFSAQLVTVGGRKVATGKDFDENTGKIREGADVLLLSEEEARALQERLQQSEWRVRSVEHRQQVRKPPAPFTTSTLQQEANRKLNMTARQAMQVAQRLYEDGYITYMRTDSVSLSQEAIGAARKRIESSYGTNYLSDQPRQYTNKTKNAQEAHEAIRPAGDEMKTGEELGLSGRELSLYTMIWKRTMATQMAEARLRFDTVTIESGDAEFRATGRHIEFPGFFRAYVEGVDDPEAALDDEESALPQMSENDDLKCRDLEAVGHETKPPARYTEATLVRKLEQEGIGRPSTYASIIGTIQDRGYVQKVSNQLIPTFTAMAVTRLLEQYFPQLVDLQFTAQMEQSLDDISNGEGAKLGYLKKFYSGEEGLEEQVKSKEETIDPRRACTLELDGIESAVRVGRFGPYLERQENGETMTASLPNDISPADVSNELVGKLFELKAKGPQSLGMHPEEGLPIFVLSGPFGPYLQLGEVTDENPKPKRVSIPKNIEPTEIELDKAIQLLNLPRRLGHHPEDGKVVNAGIGRYGPYVQHAGKYKSLGKDDDVLTVTLDRAVELLKQVKGRAAATPVKELGKHPDDGETIGIFEGRYGPYVKHGKVNATIPKDREIESVTLEEALIWLEEKAAKKGTGRKKATKKKAAKKKAAKKSAKKKSARKKAAKKKAAAED